MEHLVLTSWLQLEGIVLLKWSILHDSQCQRNHHQFFQITWIHHLKLYKQQLTIKLMYKYLISFSRIKQVRDKVDGWADWVVEAFFFKVPVEFLLVCVPPKIDKILLLRSAPFRFFTASNNLRAAGLLIPIFSKSSGLTYSKWDNLVI